MRVTIDRKNWPWACAGPVDRADLVVEDLYGEEWPKGNLKLTREENMTIIQPSREDWIPLGPPAWTDEELSRLEADWHTDRHRLDMEEMQNSVNLEFENAFDWLLWSTPSARRLDVSVQVTLALAALHLELPD